MRGPDIRELAQFARKHEPVRRSIEQFMGLEFARSVSLRVMPWLFFDPFENPRMRARWDELELLDPNFWHRPVDAIGRERMSNPRDIATIDEAFERLARYRELGLCEKYEAPIELTLCCDIRKTSELGPDKWRSMLFEAITDRTLLMRVEEAFPFELQGGPATKIRNGGRNGTLGALALSASGANFAFTCAHVATDGWVFDQFGARIGSVRFASSPVVMPPGSVCNPDPLPGEIGAPLNQLDCALVELDYALPHQGQSLATRVCQEDEVEVIGRHTWAKFKLGSLAVALCVKHNGEQCCFQTMIELFPLEGRLTKPGDSGASVVLRGTGDWAATLVGSDGVRSVAIDARRSHAWAKAQLGEELIVV